jgi:hypothetical protein
LHVTERTLARPCLRDLGDFSGNTGRRPDPAIFVSMQNPSIKAKSRARLGTIGAFDTAFLLIQ